MINTPISKCVIGTDHCSETEKCKYNEQDGDAKVSESNIVSTSPKDQYDNPGNESGRTSEDSTCSGGAHSFHSVIGHGKNLEDLEESFMGMANATNDLNQIYATRYMDWIVGYLLEWEEIVSTR